MIGSGGDADRMNKGGLCCVGAAEKRNCVQEIMV